MPARRSLSVVAVLLLAVPALAQRNPLPERHESEDGKFRVNLPRRAAKPETKKLPLGNGQIIPVVTERAESSSGAVFAVTYSDYPEAYRLVATKTILDGVRDGLKGTDGKVTRDEEVFVGDGPDKVAGREYRVEAGTKVVHTRVFLRGSRLYQVMVTGTKDSVQSRSRTVEEFFKSFELTK
jgi:hypothetical protein